MRAPRPPRRGEPTPSRRTPARPEGDGTGNGPGAKASGAKGTGSKTSGAKATSPKAAGRDTGKDAPASTGAKGSGRGAGKGAPASTGARGATKNEAGTAVATRNSPPPVHERGARRGPARPAASLEDRRTEKADARRRLTRRRILIGLAVVLVLGGAVWALLFSPLTALDEVSASSTAESPYVDLEEVSAAADPQLGTPLARVDTGAVDEAVSALPGVADAEVVRSWPHGLEIEVAPRVPVAVTQEGDGWALLDETGSEVATVAEPDGTLPQVDVPDDPDQATRALERLLGALGEMPTELRSQVASASATSPGVITLTLADGAEVLWGSEEDSALKSEVLLVLLEQAPSSRYDVSVPGRPTTG